MYKNSTEDYLQSIFKQLNNMEEYYNMLAEAYEAEDNFWKELWEDTKTDSLVDYYKENYFEI